MCATENRGLRIEYENADRKTSGARRVLLATAWKRGVPTKDDTKSLQCVRISFFSFGFVTWLLQNVHLDAPSAEPTVKCYKFQSCRGSKC